MKDGLELLAEVVQMDQARLNRYLDACMHHKAAEALKLEKVWDLEAVEKTSDENRGNASHQRSLGRER